MPSEFKPGMAQIPAASDQSVPHSSNAADIRCKSRIPVVFYPRLGRYDPAQSMKSSVYAGSTQRIQIAFV